MHITYVCLKGTILKREALSHLSRVRIPLWQQWSAGVLHSRVGIHRKPITWWGGKRIVLRKINVKTLRRKNYTLGEKSKFISPEKDPDTHKQECLHWARRLPAVTRPHGRTELSEDCVLSVSGCFPQAGACGSEVATAASMEFGATGWADYITS